ncbi:probable phospholipid hydroperoxide glutathione peroxidase [Sitophilus oryzae]|uniref:Glutathione peroxidase n=1 Tax=Sitophilus oryzae TaxID=7048 RepID=A0A6J2XT74_SITOR|nr:probable phospholipid hydroperoxide glutathione peroxidase [Sitophilus oryzae]
MPPKKNPKTTNNSDNTNEIVSKTKQANGVVSDQVPTRVLRPRKAPTEVKSKLFPKLKQGKGKADKPSGTKSVKSKEQKTKNKKTPSEKIEEEEGEPQSKRSKGNELELEPSEDHLKAESIYDFTAKDITGKEVSLDKYKGHVCVIVNVASRCGHTSSNYKEFVQLYDKYSDSKGLKILAFPCNQFGRQEPGDNDKICEFAKKKDVKFDMFEKIEVNGDNAHPLWKYLKMQKEGPKGEDIDWNFTKFLIDKQGQVVERFKSAVKPLALLKHLEELW